MLCHSCFLLLSVTILHPGSRTPLNMQGMCLKTNYPLLSREIILLTLVCCSRTVIRMAKKVEKIWQPGARLLEPCHVVKQMNMTELSTSKTMGEHGEKRMSQEPLSGTP